MKPRVIEPVALGDTVVWVSGVTPGAAVNVHSGASVIGQVQAGDPMLPVTVRAVDAPVHVVASLGGESATGVPVTPVRDPGTTPGFPLPLPQVVESDVDFGVLQVPEMQVPEGVDGGFDVPLQGRLYVRIGDGGAPRPLVIIAHGYWGNPEEPSLRGYAWLARHLARWGMTVCSIDLSTVNVFTNFDGLQQSTRAEVILKMIERLAGTPIAAVDRDRVGLVGHSMGGEAVAVAQALNVARHQPFGIRGVVSLAPTNYRTDVANTHAAYLQLHGSLDYLLDSTDFVGGNSPRFGGFRLYDRAWRPRSLAWIEGARHEGWNSVWFNSPNSGESPAGGLPELTLDEQQAVGKAYITAFFLDTLAGRAQYRGYLSGPARPRSIGNTRVFLEHQSPSVVVVDDFGDADGQSGTSEEQPPNEAVNRRGQAVTATGVDRWDDVEHRTLPHSVHDTRGTDVAWRAPGARYESGLGTLVTAETATLSLRVAQHYDERDDGEPDETWNPVGLRADLSVELDDGTRRARVRLGVGGSIPYPLLGREVYSVFRTVRLPLDAFTAVEPALNLRALRTVRLLFDLRTRGRLLIDDVEFDQPLETAPSRISMLRVHDRGGFGPNDDHLEGEVVVQLVARSGESFGFPLRDTPGLHSARGMFAVLREALVTGAAVRLEYVPAGRTVRDVVAVRRG